MIKNIVPHVAKIGHAEHPLMVVYAGVEAVSAHNLIVMIVTILLVITGIVAIMIKEA